MSGNKCLVAIGLQNRQVDENTVREAILWAQARSSELEAVLVIPATKNEYVQTFVRESVQLEVEKNAKRDLDNFISQFLPKGMSFKSNVLHGKPYKAILELANTITPSVIVIGAHKEGLFEFNMGSSASRIARHAQCSVLVVRN